MPPTPRVRRLCTTLLTAAFAFGLAALTLAQRGYMFQYSSGEANVKYDGRFTFARLKFNCTDGYGYPCYYYRGVPAWAHGYARTDKGQPAEREMMQILNSISAVHPRVDDTNAIAIDDPELCKYPVSFMTEAGFWTLSDKEAQAFGAYMRKGGFVIFDDFRDPPRGGGGFGVFAENMRRVLPGLDIVQLDPTHPIFHSFFEIDSFDIIPQSYDRVRPTISGIFEDNDRSKRLMAIINYNTDISDFWEFAGTGTKPVADSNKAFELGVNYIIYGLTH